MTVDDDRAHEVGFAGRWQSADGGVHAIVQHGDVVRFDSEREDGAALHGRGRIIAGTAVLVLLDAFGNQSRVEVALTADGSQLHGRQTGPTGVAAIRLTRRE